jgi:hypothetical protein
MNGITLVCTKPNVPVVHVAFGQVDGYDAPLFKTALCYVCGLPTICVCMTLQQLKVTSEKTAVNYVVHRLIRNNEAYRLVRICTAEPMDDETLGKTFMCDTRAEKMLNEACGPDPEDPLEPLTPAAEDGAESDNEEEFAEDLGHESEDEWGT